MRRLIAVTGMAVLLVVAGCGDDDGGQSADSTSDDTDTDATTTSTEPVGSDDEFCDALAEVKDVDPDVVPDEEDIAGVAAAAAVAPTSELREQTLVIADLGDQLVGIDLEDQAAVDAANERATDPEVTEAAEALATYADDTCGFDVAIFSSLAGTGASDDDGGDDSTDGSEVDVDPDQLRDAIADEDADIEAAITSVVSVNGEYTLGIIGLTDPGDATDICTTAATALANLGADSATVKVGDTEGNVLATGDAGSECEAA